MKIPKKSATLRRIVLFALCKTTYIVVCVKIEMQRYVFFLILDKKHTTYTAVCFLSNIYEKKKRRKLKAQR
jgi:hypothetical protein